MADNLLQQDNIMYIDPNRNHFLGGVKQAPDLSDYCIYVNLIARIPLPSTTATKSKGEKVISMTYVSDNKEKEDRVIFNEGTTLKVRGNGKNENYLTTSPYSYGTYSDVYKERTKECFGINSIDIEYNNYLIPCVTIQFTDIRGISLFAPTEEKEYSRVLNEKEQEDFAGSFFKCFFTFPYPQFLLHVKGFYGEPASYHLTVQDFRASFDSNSGNFNATVKFVGYQGALLGDIMANALTVAPYTQQGKEWWAADSASKFALTGTNGESVEMPTLVDFMTKVASIGGSLGEITKDSPLYDQKMENESETSELSDINAALNNYIKELRLALEKGQDSKNKRSLFEDDGKLMVFYPSKDSSVPSFSSINNNDKVKDAYDALIEKLNAYSIGGQGNAYNINVNGIRNNNKSSNERCKILKEQVEAIEKKRREKEENKSEEERAAEEEQTNKENSENQEDAKPKLVNRSSRDFKITLDFKGFGESGTTNVYSLKNTSSIPKDIIDRKPNYGCSNVLVYDYSVWHKNFKTRLDAVDKERGDIDAAKEKLAQENATNVLGFQPTVKNITQIFLAHLDILLRLILNTRDSVISSNRRGSNFGLGGDYVGPFPLLTSEVKREESTNKEDAWIGELSPGEPEAILTEDLLEATKRTAVLIQNTQEALGGGENASYAQEAAQEYLNSGNSSDIPTSNNEFDKVMIASGKSPFYKENNIKKEDVYKQLLNREVNIVAATNNANLTTDNFVKWGTADAKNFMQAQGRKLPDELKGMISANGLSYNDYMSFVAKYDKTLVKQGSNNRYVYNSTQIPYGKDHIGINADGTLSGNIDNNGEKKIRLKSSVYVGNKEYVEAFFKQLVEANKPKEEKKEDNKLKEDKKDNDQTEGGNESENTTTSATLNDQINNSTNIQTTIDMKIGTYKYLKLLNDRWLCFNGSYEDMWKYEVYKDRWVYMDSFYNKNGNELLLNVKDIINRLIQAQSAVDISLYSLLSLIYQDNHASLHCIHNFLDTTNVSGMQDPEKLSRIFDPIPYQDIKWDKLDNAYPFNIVLYSSEYSHKLAGEEPEDHGDSFNVADYINGRATISPSVPIEITSRNVNGGYKIPCFGVNYGAQYQSYFRDINIDMNTPMITAESIKNQFIIASQNAINGSTDSDKKFHTIGQDLYTIYSNNSYTCTVKMLGCAYIQPLMYFQLNNIQMFSGTYIIQRVTHHIEPGNMETTFVGVRMANKSTKLVKDWILATGGSGSVDNNGMSQEDIEGQEADVSNNCMYKHFSPSYGASDVVFPANELEMTKQQYMSKYPLKGSKWQQSGRIASGDKRVIDILSHTLNAEIGTVQNEHYNVGKMGAAMVIFNRWIENGKNLQKFLYYNQHDTINQAPSSDSADIARKIMTNPASMIGTQSWVSRSIPIIDFGVQKGNTSSMSLKEDNLNHVNLYCSKQGYDINYPNKKYTEKKTRSGGKWTNLWHNAKYGFHQDLTSVYGSIQSGMTGKAMWHPKPPQPKKGENKNTKLLKSLHDSIQATLSYSSKLNNITLNDYDLRGNSSIFIRSKDNNGYKNAKIFDVVVNCYYNDVLKACWVTKNNDIQANPSGILITIGKGKKMFGMINSGYTNMFRINYNNAVNKNFLLTIKKKYGIFEKGDTAKISELPNFSTKTNQNGAWYTYMNNMLKTVNVEDCPVSGSLDSIGGGYTFEGTDKGYTGNGCKKFARYDPNKTVAVLKKRQNGGYGSCAIKVREAFEIANNVNTNGRPVSACAYVHCLPKWGFRKVYQGVAPNSFSSPQKGDVAVIAGLSHGPRGTKDLYGHIQVYDGNGKWWSDYGSDKQYCYNDAGRPFTIWRWNG